MKYLGFWVTQNGIQPINKKVEAIINMMPPTSEKQVREFIVLVNHYRGVSDRLLHLLQPLTTLTSYQVNFKWTEL